MIRLFSRSETDFTHNGIHVLDDIIIGDTCILSNGINEGYSLECELTMFDNSKWKDIENEMFLRVPTPRGEQIFRIKEIVKGFNSLRIYGKHVFFDLENNFILDTNVVEKDGRSAIAQILGTMTNNMVNSFHGTSDISILNNSRLVRKNVVTALIGNDENSFLNRWGGELQVDNFNFAINKRIGTDRGFQIRYAKNATGYEGNINTYNLCTRIVPVGFDGLMLEGTKWVDSPNIAKYPQIYTYEVKFEDIKVKENEDDEEGYNTIEEAREALREAALKHFLNTKCDLPTFSGRVNFITLENTEEYKNVRFLEKVELGDDVSIYLSNIDVNASSRIVKTKYNFFTKKYIEVEIGEAKPNIFKQLINIKDTIDLIVENLGGNTWQDIINKSLDEAAKLMQEGLKDSYVITMKNQIVIGDAPDINNMVNCIVMNKNGIGFSNNGYLPDQLTSAMTIDGKINASCITTGQLNASLIKTGTLTSSNGKTWINMENGTFNFSDKIKFDGSTMEMDITSLKHGANGYSTTIQQGGLIFETTNEKVGAIRSTRMTDNNQINGVSIVAMAKGDYLDLGSTTSDTLDATATFNPSIRITTGEHELTGNFKGIQLKADTRIDKGRTLYFQDASLTAYPHEIFGNTDDGLSIYGNNGVTLGYKSGHNLMAVLKITETAGSSGSRIWLQQPTNSVGFFMQGDIDMNQYNLKNVGNFGSIESKAPRISNMNAILPSGWYAFGDDCTGTPVAWGVMLTFKAFVSGENVDMCQIVHGTNNVIYTRWWVNNSYTAWKTLQGV